MLHGWDKRMRFQNIRSTIAANRSGKENQTSIHLSPIMASQPALAC
jgi:hypothetical protein